MKTSSCLTYSIASASLLALSFAHGLEGTHAPKLSTDDFHQRLHKDDTGLPNGGQLQMSYANVVDKILPSVVTVFSFGSGKGHQPEIDIEQLSPYERRLFEYFRGQQEEDEESQFPRGRRGAPNPRGNQEKKLQPNGVGSGVIISTDGYILTNNHVVGEADKLEAVIDVKGVSKRFVAKIIGADPKSDVALIKIEAFDLTPATLTDSTKLRVGDIVLAAGAPMELSRSVTQGIVSALGRSGMGIIGRGNERGYEDFIQTDAAINPGNSGGPLVDALGRVVGINTAIYSKSGMSAGIGFAIPINMALRVAEDLIDDGSVTRGFLGILPMNVDEEAMKVWGLSDESGALVEYVTNNSPAAKAGVQVGDLITSVEGQKIENASKLPLIVSSFKPGTEISINVIRDGKPSTLKAKLIKLTPEILAGEPIGSNTDEDEDLPANVAPTTANVAEIIDGVTVQNLTPSTRERYDVPDEIMGVIVTRVNDQSQAAARGIEEGDVILEVGLDKKVRAVGEAVEFVKASGKKVLLKVWRGGDSLKFMLDR